MTGINTGILQNAIPLSAEQIKSLEKQVIENGKAFAYLDEQSKLCFAMSRGVDNIKELAWNHAYELRFDGDKFYKKAYSKTSLNSFKFENEKQKVSYADDWQEAIYILTATEDGRIPATCYYYSGEHGELLPGQPLPHLYEDDLVYFISEDGQNSDYSYYLARSPIDSELFGYYVLTQ